MFLEYPRHSFSAVFEHSDDEGVYSTSVDALSCIARLDLPLCIFGSAPERVSTRLITLSMGVERFDGRERMSRVM